jgi:hypothetical protein
LGIGLGSGAELLFGLGGPGPPQAKGFPPKKKKKSEKKKDLNFTPYFFYFLSFGPPKIFFSIWPPNV